MKKTIFVLFLVMLLMVIPSSGDISKSNSSLKVTFDDHFNQGNDLTLRMQLKANLTSIEILVDYLNSSDSIFYGTYHNPKINEIKTYTISANILSESGSYQIRIVTEIYNSSIVNQLFLNITVVKVLQNEEILYAMLPILFIIAFPFLFDKDKARIERNSWNILSNREYVRNYTSKFKIKWLLILAIISIIVYGGYYYVF